MHVNSFWSWTGVVHFSGGENEKTAPLREKILTMQRFCFARQGMFWTICTFSTQKHGWKQNSSLHIFKKESKIIKKKQGKNVTPKPRCKRVKWYALIFHFAATTYAKICQKMCSAQLPTKLCLAYPPCLPATASFYSHNFDLHLKNILARLHPCTPQEGHNSQPHTDGRSHV